MEEFVVMKSFNSLIVKPENEDTELCNNNNNNEKDDLPNIVQNLHDFTFFWDMTLHYWVIGPKHFEGAMSFGTSETGQYCGIVSQKKIFIKHTSMKTSHQQCCHRSLHRAA